jgi:hypothetical protein
VGRNPKDIRRLAALGGAGTISQPDEYVAAGFTHLIAIAIGPDWDLSAVRNLLKWRDARC